MIIDEEHYQISERLGQWYRLGYRDRRRRGAFAPPDRLVDRVCYHAGFNQGKGVNIYACMSDRERAVLDQLLDGTVVAG